MKATQSCYFLESTTKIEYDPDYCSENGLHPGFREPPLVQQLTPTSVNVNWEDLVNLQCVSNFLVKYWESQNPYDQQLSDELPADQFRYIVPNLVPNQEYVFQVCVFHYQRITKE